MAEAAVSFVVEAFGNLVIEEAKFLHGVRDQVKQLQLELERLQSFLKDADARQHEDEMIKVWISQARDVVYEAVDLIESYAFKVASRRRKGIRGITKRCIGIPSECYARHTIGTDIQTLKTTISNLSKSFEEYGIRAVMERQDGASLSHQQWRRTYSHFVEDDFVGLEEDVEMLVKHLLRGSDHETDQCFRVVSTCGMGGLGKTTVARKVYNHPEVRRWFDGLAWVCVSQNWKKEGILQQILLRLIPEKKEEIEKWGDAELVRQLFQIQQKEKCLVVLDDIWSTDAWDCIKDAFPIRNDGSKILVTSPWFKVSAESEMTRPSRNRNGSQRYETVPIRLRDMRLSGKSSRLGRVGPSRLRDGKNRPRRPSHPESTRSQKMREKSDKNN